MGYFFALIEDKGSTGFVLRYHNEKNPNKFEIILPKNSPPIISDYNSKYGVLGGKRKKKHNTKTRRKRKKKNVYHNMMCLKHPLYIL